MYYVRRDMLIGIIFLICAISSFGYAGENGFWQGHWKDRSIDSIVECLIQEDIKVTPYKDALQQALQAISSGKIDGLSSSSGISIFPFQKKNTYILSFSSDEFFLGQGNHKKVEKIVVVSPQKVFFAALSEGDSSVKSEVECLQKTQGMKGIIPFIGVLNKKGTLSFVSKYCNFGDLRRCNRDKNPELSFYEKLCIAQDLAVGLSSLHHKSLIHFDITAANVFLDKNSTRIRAYLGDFGRTFSVSKAKKRPAYVSKYRMPVESLVIPLLKIDRFKTDVYALGALLYEMVWFGHHPWGYIIPVVHVHFLPKKRKKMLYYDMVRLYEEDKKLRLNDIMLKKSRNEELTTEDQFKEFIFTVMDPDPAKRPTADEIVQYLSQLKKHSADFC